VSARLAVSRTLPNHDPEKRGRREDVVHMGLVYRDGRPYLYRSVRRGGRVTSEYRGSGETALLFTQWDAIDRDEKDYGRSEASDERKHVDDLEMRLDELCAEGDAIAREALTAAGYHQHHRGDWRKRRVD
jgi:hypothetical protein